jgi:hypothetical protein
MTRNPLITVFALCALLAGCVATPGAAPTASAPAPTPVRTPPPLDWDTSPDQILIEAMNCCGLVPPSVAQNYIPARVWGDGRVVWAEDDGRGGRRVLEGQLTPTEARALLQRFADAGFFGWNEHYQPEITPTDQPLDVLTVRLNWGRKSVSVYGGGAPPAFDTLQALVLSGAGVAGHALAVPERAYLLTLPATGANVTPTHQWPDASAGFTLDQAIQGRPIEGEAAAFAWRTLNENLNAVVASGGKTYSLFLMVSRVTEAAPPVP